MAIITGEISNIATTSSELAEDTTQFAAGAAVASEPRERARSTQWALVSLSLAMILSSLGTSVANVALPTIAEDFNASFAGVQWIVIGYLLAATTLVVGAGRLGDHVGRRRLLLAGVALFTAASALCSLAPTLGMLVAARVLQGVGAAAMMALTLAFVAETVAETRTGRIIGMLATMSAVGTALGPALGGALIAGFGWRSIFLVNLPLGLAALLIGLRSLPGDRARDVATAPTPLIDRRTLRDPQLRAALGMSALVMTALMSTLVVGPFFLSSGLALDAAHVGLALSIGPAVAAAAGVPAGWTVDRFGAGRTSLAGLIAIGAGAVLLAAMPAEMGIAGYLARIALITAGHGLFQAANSTAVMRNAPVGDRGMVSGMLTLARNLGLIAGATVMSAAFALGSGTLEIEAMRPESVVPGMRATFATAAILVVLALAIAVRGQSGARAQRYVRRPQRARTPDTAPRRRRPDWLIAAGLLVLALVPSIAGSMRIAGLASNAVITPENARFVASPIPVIVHIVASVVYAIVGVVQFLPRFRSRRMRWHRVAGWVIFVGGLLSAGSGLWMTLFYPWTGFDGEVVYVLRLLAGSSMVLALVLGVVSAIRHDIAGHRAWMMRAYAIGIAAGTQVFTHIPLLILPEHQNETTRAIAMGAAWVINVLVAEWLIRKPTRGPRPAMTSSQTLTRSR